MALGKQHSAGISSQTFLLLCGFLYVIFANPSLVLSFQPSSEADVQLIPDCHQSPVSRTSFGLLEPDDTENTRVDDNPENQSEESTQDDEILTSGDEKESIPSGSTKKAEAPDREGRGNDGNGALYVEVRGYKVYGGLKTFQHSLLSTQVCRLLNPCLTRNGTLVLPRWMRRHDDVLRSQCDVTDVEFSLNDREAPAGKFIPEDLFGIATPRHHMPHFLRDFVPNLISLDTAYGERELHATCHTRKGTDCADFPLGDEDIRPNVFLHPRTKLIGNASWVRQFVKLLPPIRPEASGPAVLYQTDLFGRKRPSAELLCFRSAYLAKPAPAGQLIDTDLLDTHILFRKHHIKRTRRQHDRSGGRRKCTLSVTVLGRNATNQPRFSRGREILNLSNLTKSLRNASSHAPEFAFRVKSMFFEGKTIQEQIDVMQNTDILIASHGAGLTNMIFMRGGSSLLELQPFEYYPDTYETMARTIADLDYDSYIADPDLDSFESCISHYNKPGDVEYERIQGILERLRTAAKKFTESRNTHSIQLHKTGKEDFILRVCARAQRLKVDPAQVVRQVLHLAERQCNKLDE